MAGAHQTNKTASFRKEKKIESASILWTC